MSEKPVWEYQELPFLFYIWNMNERWNCSFIWDSGILNYSKGYKHCTRKSPWTSNLITVLHIYKENKDMAMHRLKWSSYHIKINERQRIKPLAALVVWSDMRRLLEQTLLPEILKKNPRTQQKDSHFALLNSEWSIMLIKCYWELQILLIFSVCIQNSAMLIHR